MLVYTYIYIYKGKKGCQFKVLLDVTNSYICHSQLIPFRSSRILTLSLWPPPRHHVPFCAQKERATISSFEKWAGAHTPCGDCCAKRTVRARKINLVSDNNGINESVKKKRFHFANFIIKLYNSKIRVYFCFRFIIYNSKSLEAKRIIVGTLNALNSRLWSSIKKRDVLLCGPPGQRFFFLLFCLRVLYAPNLDQRFYVMKKTIL